MKRFTPPADVKDKKRWRIAVHTLIEQRAFQLCRANLAKEDWQRCLDQAQREFEQGKLAWFMPDSVALLASALERSLGRV